MNETEKNVTLKYERYLLFTDQVIQIRYFKEPGKQLTILRNAVREAPAMSVPKRLNRIWNRFSLFTFSMKARVWKDTVICHQLLLETPSIATLCESVIRSVLLRDFPELLRCVA